MPPPSDPGVGVTQDITRPTCHSSARPQARGDQLRSAGSNFISSLRIADVQTWAHHLLPQGEPP